MLNKDNRNTHIKMYLPDDAYSLFNFSGIQAGRYFIKKQNTRLGCEGRGHGHPFLRRYGELADPLVFLS